jgi:hypothetical protein
LDKTSWEKSQGSNVLKPREVDDPQAFFPSWLDGSDRGVVMVFLGAVRGSSKNFPSLWGVTFISGAVSVTPLRV